MEKTVILTHQEILKKVERIAWQILEDHFKQKEIYLVGISSRGYKFAKKIASVLNNISTINVYLNEITINKKDPIKDSIILDCEKSRLENKSVIVIDDVLNSGRTMIYAVHYFLDVHISKISTAVLVDRSHNTYPIKSNYVGLQLSTSLQEHVCVDFGKNDSAYLQ